MARLGEGIEGKQGAMKEHQIRKAQVRGFDALVERGKIDVCGCSLD